MVGEVPVLLIMKRPIVVSGDVSVYDVAKLMIEEEVPCVLVVCERSKNEIEVAREKDILKKVLIKKLSPDKVKIEDISSSKLITIPPETTIDEALKLMSKHKTRELFISDGGKIIGVITEEDLIKITPEIISTLKELVDYLIQVIDEVTSENSNEGGGEDPKTLTITKNKKKSK
ncbi:putative signal transduction protein with CBS domains [Methanocaldococcus vulcanius M7]|uniref:Signal transduction protein with CBS domains n=1 Tax=Methanocaldococcus vulcanius (strain ATCC 700851 / DSM 12094 / M7) TaxID=579137 RepID=C9RE57_METVM|nr:CBS domain-containing protein [Methanocaldococcus vulcanius]ACX73586.1 putative signal transduction protein with CBS domains [Methanocaldococcus vulcanius M7]